MNHSSTRLGLLNVHSGSMVLLNRAPLWHRCWEWGRSAFASVLQHPDIGARLVETLHAAGLDGATASCDVLIDSFPSSPLPSWMALVIRSMAPYLERTGAATAEELDLGTLERRLRDEAAALHSQLMFLPQFSAWARKP
jgi:hypothetical protein